MSDPRSFPVNEQSAATLTWKWVLESNFGGPSRVQVGQRITLQRDPRHFQLWLALVEHVRGQSTTSTDGDQDECGRELETHEVRHLATDFGDGGPKRHFMVTISRTNIVVCLEGYDLPMSHDETLSASSPPH